MAASFKQEMAGSGVLESDMSDVYGSMDTVICLFRLRSWERSKSFTLRRAYSEVMMSRPFVTGISGFSRSLSWDGNTQSSIKERLLPAVE